jgi:hypothetical protein
MGFQDMMQKPDLPEVDFDQMKRLKNQERGRYLRTLSNIEAPNSDPKIQKWIKEDPKKNTRINYQKYSGVKKEGQDLGQYQVTSNTLAQESPKLLGRPVSDDEFLSSGSLQRKFMEARMESAKADGLPYEKYHQMHRFSTMKDQDHKLGTENTQILKNYSKKYLDLYNKK